jgi:tetratricopeptide (TPR) repeat protein
MGTIARFHFDTPLIERFPTFVETGTGRGAGVRFAQDYAFKCIRSVDTEQVIVDHARRLFEEDARITVECDESLSFLKQVLRSIPLEEGVVFWLDAHFPGSDVLGVAYDSEVDRIRRLPLQEELELIRDLHPWSIVLVDDLRLYMDGPFVSGNVHQDHTGLAPRDRLEVGKAIYSIMQATHVYSTFYEEEGYLVLVPFGEEGPKIVDFTAREYCEAARRYVEIGDAYAAKSAYTRVLQTTDPPDRPWKRIARGEACKFMAQEAREKNNMGTAVDWWHRAMIADPLDTQGRVDYIFQGLMPLQWFEVARAESERARFIDPDNPLVWQCSAAVERESCDIVATDKMVAKALELGPDNPGSHLVAALCFADTSRFEEAKAHYRKVMELSSHRAPEAMQGLGIVLDREGRTEEAVEWLDQAIADWSGDDTMVRWNRSEMLLTLGRYKEGWADHAIRRDERFHRGCDLSAFGRLAKRFLAPILSADDKPCRVHVHPEMGAGDTFCMARYIPLLVDMGHDVRLEVSTKMVDLFKGSFPNVKVTKQALDYPGALGLSEFDRHATTMMFPNIFGTTLETIPWSGPYIKADPDLSAVWSDRLGSKGRMRVGLCWSSGIRSGFWYTEYGKRKSMSFSELSPLLDLDASFFSLQVGPEAAENTFLPGLPGASTAWKAGATSADSELNWSDTAAVISLMDLVITVDTGIAHLAGAMGKPVWLMMHCGGSWHHMRPHAWGGRCESESPWYPSMKIIRQERPHEWAPVVNRVRNELTSTLNTRA